MSSTNYRRWTYPDLRRAAAEVESGRTWPDVAADYGVSGATLRTCVRRYGLACDRSPRPAREHPEVRQVVRALALRNAERLSWSIIAERVGWARQPQSLARACQRHTARHGGDLYAGNPRVRRSKWDAPC